MRMKALRPPRKAVGLIMRGVGLLLKGVGWPMKAVGKAITAEASTMKVNPRQAHPKKASAAKPVAPEAAW